MFLPDIYFSIQFTFKIYLQNEIFLSLNLKRKGQRMRHYQVIDFDAPEHPPLIIKSLIPKKWVSSQTQLKDN